MRPGQRTDLLLLVAWSFCVVAEIFIGRTVRDTLFLANEGAARLPIMYIASPLAVTLVGLVYGRLADRLPRDRVAPATAVVVAILLVAARFGLGPHWLYYVLYAGLDVASTVLTMQFWLAAGDRFSAREAKRLFAVLTAAGTSASVITGLAVTAIVPITGAENLLLGGAGLSLLVAVLATTLARRSASATATPNAKPVKTTAPAAGTRHLDLLAPMIVVTLLAVTLIDFQFKSITSAAYANDRVGMVRFFGLMYVCTAATSLAIQLLFARKIIARFGVAGALLLLPTTLALGATALLVAPSLFTATASKAADATFRSSIDSAGQQLLYLPAPAGERARRKRRIDMLIKPGAEGTVGIALLLYRYLVGARLPLAITAVAAIAAWIGLVLRMRFAYVQSVADTLHRRRIAAPEDPGETVLAAEAIRGVREALASDDAMTIRRGIDLARFDPTRLTGELRALFVHPDAGVRADAIACTAELTDAELAAALADESPDVRAAAARAAGANQIAAVAPLLDAAPVLAAAAAAAMVRHAPDRRGELVERLSTWVLDRERRKVALDLVESAADPELIAQLVPALATAIESADDAAAVPALRALGRLAPADAIERLVAVLDDGREIRRTAAAEALAELRRRHPDRAPPLEPVLAACRAEITRAFTAMAASAGLGHAESIMKADGTRIEVPYQPDNLVGPAALLSRALRERSERCRDRVFDLLAALEPSLEIALVRANLRDPNPVRRANAVELLDARSWPASVASVKQFALAIVDDTSRDAKLAAATQKLKLPKYSRDGWIDRLLSDRNPWIRACSAYYAGAARDFGAREHIAKLTDDPNPLVSETARECLRVLDHPKDKPKMLTTAEKVLFLKGAELFAAIPAEDVAAIATVAAEVTFDEGATIFSAGEPGDALYLVVEGKVRIAAGDKQLAELGTREVFGEMALLDPAPRSATAIAAAPVVAVRLGQDDFSDVLAERPEVARGVLRVLVRRLRAANVQA